MLSFYRNPFSKRQCLMRPDEMVRHLESFHSRTLSIFDKFGATFKISKEQTFAMKDC